MDLGEPALPQLGPRVFHAPHLVHEAIVTRPRCETEPTLTFSQQPTEPQEVREGQQQHPGPDRLHVRLALQPCPQGRC